MKKHLRILSLLMLLVMLFGMFPVFAVSDLPQNQQEQVPQTAPPESEPTEVTMPTETAAPTEATVPTETQPTAPAEHESEETQPTVLPETEPETTMPSVPETSVPIKNEATAPSEPETPQPTAPAETEPKETQATAPTEPQPDATQPTTPAETEPDVTQPTDRTETIEDQTIFQVGDLLFAVTDDVDMVDGAMLYRSASVPYGAVSVASRSSYSIDLTEFKWYVPLNENDYTNVTEINSPDSEKGGIHRVAHFMYFLLSDGRIGYCIEPSYTEPDQAIEPNYNSVLPGPLRGGVNRALAYGAPNNGDDSEEGKIATSILVWDIATGYRGDRGDYNVLRGRKFTSTPFEDAINSLEGINVQAVKSKYYNLVSRMKNDPIPSFTSKDKNQIGATQTITLNQQMNGSYSAEITDSNDMLPTFDFVAPSGVTLNKSGNTLKITVSKDAAANLDGTIIESTTPSAGRCSYFYLNKPDPDTPRAHYQTLIALDARFSPVQCFFKIKLKSNPGTARLIKTSDADKEGYCFKLYRWDNNQSWYGKTDTSGYMYLTKSDYHPMLSQNGSYIYEWTGLEDGDYAILEALSYNGSGKVFPTSIKLTVKSADGKTYTTSFSGNEIEKDSNGDAHPVQSHIPLKGLSGGGTLTIEIHNAQNSYPFTLRKTGGKVSGQLIGNACYSLEGAEFSVKTEAGEFQETLRTDANGNAVSKKSYPIGTRLVITETKAPKGYIRNEYPLPTLTITKGNNEITAANAPSLDPRSLRFGKKDPKTGLIAPQGNSSFEGAIFKWEYFDNYDFSGTPKRVWYFRTDSKGTHDYDKSYLATGYKSDSLYVDAKGGNRLPLGSVRVTEIVAPTGYGKLKPLYATTKQQSDGRAKFEWTPESQKIVESKDGKYLFPEPIVNYGSLSIQKKDADTGGAAPNWVNFSGCQFTVYNNSSKAVKVGNYKTAQPGEACYVLTLDAAGHASTGKIFPVGKYTIKETKGNQYYQCNTKWSQTFEVKSSGNAAFSFTVSNTPVKGHISLRKTDSETNARLKGAIFQVTYPDGKKVNMTEGADGLHSIKNLRYGTYKVQEIVPPTGFILDTSVYTVNIRENGKTYHVTVDGNVPNVPIKGHIQLTKVDGTDGKPLTGAVFQVTFPDGTTQNMTEGANGVHSLRDLRYGTYKVQEIKAPEGFQPDSTVYTVNIRENGKTYKIQTDGYTGIANAPIPGSISIQKVDTHGNTMEGVTFLLEYSLDDGGTWQPIQSRADTDPLKPGTSSTQGIVDGKLTTNADGKITFVGLRINSQTGNIRYRLTEIATTDGHTLLAGTAFNGCLTADKPVDVQITASNGTSFELPVSGSHDLQNITVVGAVLILMTALIPVFIKKEEKNNEK